MSHEVVGGIAQGAATGSAFGPIGAVIGGVFGGIMGSRGRSKRRRAEALQLKRNTKQAYNIGSDSFSSIRKNKENAQNAYALNTANDIGRFAASGRVLTDADRNRITGSNAQTRDSALEQVNIQEDTFRNTQAYKLLEKDFSTIGGIKQRSSSEGGDADTVTDYSIRAEGVSGESYFTDEQKENLRTYTDSGNYQDTNNSALFRDYAASITPTFEEYTQSRFGDDEDKAAFESLMTDRINTANQEYDTRIIESDLANARRREQQYGDD